jgi:hypothetical protein
VSRDPAELGADHILCDSHYAGGKRGSTASPPRGLIFSSWRRCCGPRSGRNSWAACCGRGLASFAHRMPGSDVGTNSRQELILTVHFGLADNCAARMG